MSATQEWIKEQFAKDSKPVITEYSLQKEVNELREDVKKLQEDISWLMRQG